MTLLQPLFLLPFPCFSAPHPLGVKLTGGGVDWRVCVRHMAFADCLQIVPQRLAAAMAASLQAANSVACGILRCLRHFLFRCFSLHDPYVLRCARVCCGLGDRTSALQCAAFARCASFTHL